MAKDAVKDAVAEEVAELAREFVRDATHAELDSRTPHPSFTSQETGHVNELFSRVPPDQGWYIKVYKRYPVPQQYGNRPVFLLDIQQPELITDVESELQRLAKAHEWGDGIYELRKFQAGKSGQQGSTQITIQVPKTMAPSSSNGITAASDAADPFSQVRTTASLIKELQTTPAGASPDAIAKAITDTVKTIVDSTKSTTAPAPPLDLPGIVNAIKGLMPPPTPVKAPEDLLTLITKLQPLLNPPRPPSSDASVIDTLIKLKTAGLLGDNAPREDATAKAIEMLGNLVPLIQSLGGGDRGETSFGVELVRALGPQIGKITGDIVETVKTVAATRPGASAPTLARVTATPSAGQISAPSEPAPVTEPSVIIAEGEPMLPIFGPIKEAVDRRDHAFFPILKSTLQTYGGEAYAQLLSGAITLDAVITYVKPFGGGFLDSVQGRLYLAEFLEWARARRTSGLPEGTVAGTPTASSGPGMAPPPPTQDTVAPPPEPEPFIVAKCPECGTEFDYDDEEAFAAEPNCEDCFVKLVRSSASTPEPPHPEAS